MGKNFGGNNSDYGCQVSFTNDNGFIIAGYMHNVYGSPYDSLVIKTNSKGNIPGGPTCDYFLDISDEIIGNIVSAIAPISYGITVKNISPTISTIIANASYIDIYDLILCKSKYIKTTFPVGTEMLSSRGNINVTWDVEGFIGNEGKIRIFFYPGGGGPYSGLYLITGNLSIADGSYTIDLSNLKDINGNPIPFYDPLRCRIRVGIYVPGSPGSFTGLWLTWTTPYGKQGQYYDESGHFWIIDQ